MKQILDVYATAIPDRFKVALQQIITNIINLNLSGIKTVCLFGSLARSQITPRSDIDICIVFENTVDYHSYEYAIAKALIDQNVAIDVDVVYCSETVFQTSNKPLFVHIRKDQKILLIAD